jgi:hypothetical protein
MLYKLCAVWGRGAEPLPLKIANCLLFQLFTDVTLAARHLAVVTNRRFFMHPILCNTAVSIVALATLLNCSPSSGVSNEPLVNGPTTSGKTRPFGVSLARGYKQFCSGALVSPKVVLTAYHCIDDEQILYNTLFGNCVEIPYTPEGLQRRSVVKIISTSPETDKAVTKGAGGLDYALLI